MSVEGATGSSADLINGIYELTEEMCDGLPTYKRIGSRNEMWMEFNSSLSKWMVRQAASRGSNKAYAYCPTRGTCLPHECPIGTWQIWSNNVFECQSSVVVALISPLPRHIEAFFEEIRSKEQLEVLLI